jgi:hypothetical protein
MNSRRLSSTSIETMLITLLACGYEVLGRLLFPNYDINYLIYGANYFSQNKLPWMDVWTGIDVIHGSISSLFSNTEIALLLTGITTNVAAALVINSIMRRYDCDRSYRIAAVVATAMFFQPTLGGWTADHISFLTGLAPALMFIFLSFRYGHWLFLTLAISLSLGITLKLNSFVPTYLLSCLWICASRLAVRPRSVTKTGNTSFTHNAVIIMPALAASAIAISALIPIEGGIYSSIFKTYSLVSESTASGQFAIDRFLGLPLQINAISALRDFKPGVIAFIPLVALFWICLTTATIKLLDRRTGYAIKEKNYVGILLISATALVTIGLGRGLSHRLFLLPAGIMLIVEDIKLQRQLKESFAYLMTAYLAIIWIVLAYVQKDLEVNRHYKLRGITTDKARVSQICLQDKLQGRWRAYNSGNSPVETLYIKTLTETPKSDSRCWDASRAQAELGGFVNVEEVANSLGFIFLNHEPAQGDYFEKWDWRKTLPGFRREWALQQADWINKNKVPYFIERLLVTPEEYNVPGYRQNIAPRKDQLRLLVETTRSKPIGQLGPLTLWKTQWANNLNRRENK